MYRQKYIDMLAGRGLAIGDKVVCTYRTPHPGQHWIHPFWVGVIEDVDETTPEGHYSQAKRCATWQYVNVRYLPNGTTAGFSQEDSLPNLLPLMEGAFGEINESP